MALILRHQTPEAFIGRVRAAYREGDSERLVKIARFLIARVQAGDVTDAQLRIAFGMSAAQWAAAKARMQTLITADNTVRSATGE